MCNFTSKFLYKTHAIKISDLNINIYNKTQLETYAKLSLFLVKIYIII
jgi:hypothetical protein